MNVNAKTSDLLAKNQQKIDASYQKISHLSDKLLLQMGKRNEFDRSMINPVDHEAIQKILGHEQTMSAMQPASERRSSVSDDIAPSENNHHQARK